MEKPKQFPDFWHELFKVAEKREQDGYLLTPLGWREKVYTGSFKSIPGPERFTSSQVDYRYLVRDDITRIALRLRQDSDSIYQELLNHQEDFDHRFDQAANLTWDPERSYQDSSNQTIKIQYTIFLGGSNSESKIWSCLHHEMVEVMFRLRNAFDPFFSIIII